MSCYTCFFSIASSDPSVFNLFRRHTGIKLPTFELLCVICYCHRWFVIIIRGNLLTDFIYLSVDAGYLLTQI